MINIVDIRPDDIVKVKVEGEENGMFARVCENGGRHLVVNYFLPTTGYYKDARVYKFDILSNTVEAESLLEHYHEWTLDDFDITNIRDTGMYVFNADICDDVSDSDISESVSDTSLDSFIVEEEGNEFPLDVAQVDSDWQTWNPPTLGGVGFKRKVDELEARYRHQNDDF